VACSTTKQVPVRQTAQLKSNLIVNDYADLEKEADNMGTKATKFKPGTY